MRRPPFIGWMGEPKAGKTHLAGSVFTSKYIDPERVLYFDNHGSTDAFDFPQWTNQTRWGVKHISPDDPEALYNALMDLRRLKFARKQYPYDVIIIDDWSEYAQADMDDRLEDDSAIVPKQWGIHGSVMRSAARLVHPAITHAAHIAIFQAEQRPDPRVKRAQEYRDGRPIFTQDSRPTKLRPFLQGAFEKEFPYKLDALWYQYMEVKAGKYLFKLQLVPTEEVAVITRWLEPWVTDPKRPKFIENPSFDMIWEFVKQNEVQIGNED